MRIDPPDLTNERVQNIVSRSYTYTLPEILRSLRRIHGVTRHKVSDMTGVTEKRLLSLENGIYSLVRNGELEALASYYGIDAQVLRDCKLRHHRYSFGKTLC